jgi:hypothetical protein
MKEGLGELFANPLANPWRTLGRGLRKLTLRGLAGLAGQGENRYIGGNLWFSYDRVLRVGPFRTRSFLLPERTREVTPGQFG